ncbi:MAG TPA: hypothetical protein VFT50_05735 [Baekduia sp.]|nr:hypothetical protein [Baekduia sp.]
MRKTRFIIAAALIAVFGFSAVAYAQTSIATHGSVSTTGGSKKHPKSGGLTFGFDVTDPAGTQPAPLETYKIGFEGGRMNLNVKKSCPAAKINAANGGDDSVCSKKSLIGSGTLKAVVGGTGQPLGDALPCEAKLRLYAAGKKNAALFVDAPLATCPAEIHQAIPMDYFSENNVSGLEFSVPQELRHQIGLDVTVVSTEVTIPKYTKTTKKVVRKHHHKKVKKKKVGLLESIGCSDDTRDLVTVFTDEAGTQYPVTTPVGKC